MSQAMGKIVAGYGNMLTAQFDSDVRQNEVAYVVSGECGLTVCKCKTRKNTKCNDNGRQPAKQTNLLHSNHLLMFK